MRLIKFRAFNTVTNTMVDLQKITPLALHVKLNQAGIFIPFHDDWKIMQFTGLFDKDGTEIYEGDVIRGKNPNLHHIVKWVDEEAGFGCYLPGTERYTRTSAGISQSWIIEFDKTVIGNIHENAEFLKETKCRVQK